MKLLNLLTFMHNVFLKELSGLVKHLILGLLFHHHYVSDKSFYCMRTLALRLETMLGTFHFNLEFMQTRYPLSKSGFELYYMHLE